MSAEFELTGDAPPEKPPGIRITELTEVIGKTVRAVFESPTGKKARNCEAVLVFEDDCWATLFAVHDGDQNDPAYLRLTENYGRRFSGIADSVADYLSPMALLAAGLVNQEQAKFIEQKLSTEKAIADANLARKLRSQADALDPPKASSGGD